MSIGVDGFRRGASDNLDSVHECECVGLGLSTDSGFSAHSQGDFHDGQPLHNRAEHATAPL